MKEAREQKKCKKCNRPFSISGNELNWLANRKMRPFVYCKQCRQIRKNEKKASGLNTKIKISKKDMEELRRDINTKHKKCDFCSASISFTRCEYISCEQGIQEYLNTNYEVIENDR